MMIDQANRLRDMVQTKAGQVPPAANMSSRVIAVSSGKGGVGKTNFTVNLALYLRSKGNRVSILDADFGLSNIEILFGVIPKYSLGDVLNSDKRIEDVITEGPMGIKFVSGGSGLSELANVTNKQLSYVIDNLSYLDSVSDIILIDTGAGIDNAVVNFIKASGETIIVTTPEPTSITDAYSLIKTVKEGGGPMPSLKVVINRVDNNEEGVAIYDKLRKVSERFLGIKLDYLGSIPFDNNLIKAVKKQQPLFISFPNSAFARSLEDIGNKLLDIKAAQGRQTGGIKSFMHRLANIFGN